MVVEVDDRNVQTVDLCESDLAFFERFGDALALMEQQIAIPPFHKRAFLQRVSVVGFEAAKPARGATHEDAIRPQHCAFGIDANSSVGRTTRVQPAHDRVHGDGRYD